MEKKRQMSVKTKKRLIIILGVLLAMLIGGCVAGNIYIDSLLNKMNKTEELSKHETNVVEHSETLEEKYGVINIALLGIDGESGYQSRRTDVMKVISLDFKNKDITISSIQRDNLVYFPMTEEYGNFNQAYLYGGAEAALETLNFNLDLDITRYVLFDFDTVPQIVDMLGGVDIKVTGSEAKHLGLGGAGTYHMDGNLALRFSRIRSIDSDYQRMGRQNKVITAIVNKLKDSNPLELLNIINQVLPLIETNISNKEITSFATNILSFDLNNIQQLQFPEKGYGDIEKTVSFDGLIHYILKDFQGNVAKIHEAVYGVEDYQVSERLEASVNRMREMYLK